MARVELYDTTLRDGAQREGISFSVEDKIKIALKLDELGIHYIEGGWPGANPKDDEFFHRAKGLTLRTSKLFAFGSTRRPECRAEVDSLLIALLEADTWGVTLVGKSWDLQVTHVLETTLEENLAMIFDSVRFFKEQGREVFFDAEHFFDGYKGNPQYALTCLKRAEEAGAGCVVLCDTNGGSLPSEVKKAVEATRAVVKVPLGIHAHNDAELAVANSLVAVAGGASQVQGTINGYGERCGNANLCSLIPNLKLKLGISCISNARIARITEVSRYVAEIANLPPDSHQPYVGASAFAHKAGLHAAAVAKLEESYQHIQPQAVGNTKRVLVSELAGRGNILAKARELGLELNLDGEGVKGVLNTVKELESRGFQFDGAEASFELLVRRAQKGYKPPFELVDFMIVVEKRRRPPTMGGEETLAEATVKVKVRGELVHTAAEGNGPVNALDNALRSALLKFYPRLKVVKLIDYKVRILDESQGTGSNVRVLIESSDGEHQWRTMGSSANIIEASWLSLADSIEYWLLKKGLTPQG